MRLIDAEALEEEIVKTQRYVPKDAVLDVACMVNRAPTIEAKPVVCCKDCKYNVANSKHEPLDITDYTDITCEYFMTDGMLPNDYCSQGVKIPVISMEDVPKLAKEMEK